MAGEMEPVGVKGRCPVCGRPAAKPTRPFCSVRCADVDLGRWLSEQYRVTGGVAPLDEDAPEDPDDGPPC